MSTPVTPGQTVGPFFSHALPYDGGNLLVPRDHPSAVRLHGTVRDGNDDPVPDALLEIWQPDSDGRVARAPGSMHRDGGTFTGWGRTGTDDAGAYDFMTVEPGATEEGRARFIAMTVFARGLLNRLFTRIYLPDDPANAADPVLRSLPPARRRTMIASRDEGDGLVFDVVLQGTAETVFLEYNVGERG